jgi:hypothetical protein
MKKIGLAPWDRTISASFFAYSVNTGFSVGWIGHWLQSIMMATSNNLSSLLKTTLLLSSKEYLPIAFGRK